jgi:1-phosphofructokinase
MFYTVTFNPSLDYLIEVKDLSLGRVNRTQQEQIYPGGKGINVSILLQNLGISSTALGFCAGFTGRELKRLLEQYGCHTDFIEIPGNTRINVKIKNGSMTDINGQGPSIPQDAQEALFHKLDALQAGDGLVLAGSIPNTLPPDVYERILQMLDGRGIHTVVDATRSLLTRVLPYHPFLIKPNHHELGEIFGKELHTKEEIVDCAQKLQEQGARNVLVSMGGQGALLVAEDGQILSSRAPNVKAVNPVGAGDSMVAGFLYGWITAQNYREAFRMGLVCGSATAMQLWLATKSQIEQLSAAFPDLVED